MYLDDLSLGVQDGVLDARTASLPTFIASLVFHEALVSCVVCQSVIRGDFTMALFGTAGGAEQKHAADERETQCTDLHASGFSLLCFSSGRLSTSASIKMAD